MSTVAEIASAIAQLPPEDSRTLQEWMEKRSTGKTRRMWTADELTEGARRSLEEQDSAKADPLWEEVMTGLYGEPRA